MVACTRHLHVYHNTTQQHFPVSSTLTPHSGPSILLHSREHGSSRTQHQIISDNVGHTCLHGATWAGPLGGHTHLWVDLKTTCVYDPGLGLWQERACQLPASYWCMRRTQLCFMRATKDTLGYKEPTRIAPSNSHHTEQQQSFTMFLTPRARSLAARAPPSTASWSSWQQAMSHSSPPHSPPLRSWARSRSTSGPLGPGLA